MVCWKCSAPEVARPMLEAEAWGGDWLPHLERQAATGQRFADCIFFD